MLTGRQEAFCKEYIIDCNGTQAAVRAGYCDRTAAQTAARLLRNVKVRARIDALMAEKDAARIASGDEVLRYLTGVMRGDIGEEVMEYTDAGAVRVTLPAKVSDRNRAAELLGKRHALFTERVEISKTARDAARELEAMMDAHEPAAAAPDT